MHINIKLYIYIYLETTFGNCALHQVTQHADGYHNNWVSKQKMEKKLC